MVATLIVTSPRVGGASTPPISGPPGAATLTGYLARGGFVFHFEEADRLAALELARQATDARSRIAEALGGDPGGTLHVYLCHDQQAFARLLGGAPGWMSGVAFSRLGWTAIRLDSASDRPWADVVATFRHELSHLLLRRAVGPEARIPRWFNEGFAMYQSGRWSFHRVKVLARGIVGGELFRLADISDTFPEREDLVRLAYAQSAAFTGYLVEQAGPRGMRRLVGLLASGVGFDDAVGQVFGESLPDLEADWRARLEVDYAWLPAIMGGTAVWAVAALLFLVAYLRTKVVQGRTLAVWEDAEADEPWPEIEPPEPWGPDAPLGWPGQVEPGALGGPSPGQGDTEGD